MNNDELINSLINKQITMVTKERFNTISRHHQKINKIEGDIVECGIWKGGMGIYLSKLFENKNIWLCDSFTGFQPLNTAMYRYNNNEPHTPGYSLGINPNSWESLVLNNLKEYGIEIGSRVKTLKGWVKDTLKPPQCPIEHISLLRIDVDAYSATREVLEFLYPKVSIGGYIIFDDSCLLTTVDAFNDYFKENKINFELLHPETDQIIQNTRSSNIPCGAYIIKR